MTGRRPRVPTHPWARHYQEQWQLRAADRSLPLWLRVACVAYGSHRANGHARFKRGELAIVFADVDPTTGAITPVDKHNLQRAIKAAIARDWLAEGSSSLCLVVPAHAVVGGPGHPNEPCPIHIARAKRKGSLSDSPRARR